MAISKALLVWLTVALISARNSSDSAAAAAGRSSKSARRSSSNWDDSFDRTFPEKLRGSGFAACGSKLKNAAGERGVCKLLAALDEQLKLLGDQSSSATSSSSSLNNSSSSCRFKDENGASLHRYASQRSPHLESLLERYTTMHRACVSIEHDNLKKIYQEKQLNPKCRYIVWSCTFGLGNKLMSLVSAFLYAMLSQRVLLLDEGSSWDKLFCEPFQGSNWRLPPGLSLKDDESPSFSEFHRLNCSGSSSARTRSSCPGSKVVPLVFSATTKPSEHRFLVCPSAMASVRNVPILNFRNSNQHFAVGFFLNPALRPVLEELFPERRVFHDLAQFLLNPSDVVWPRIKKLHDEEPRFSGAFRRVGVQLRESKDEYRDYYDMAVPRCIRSKAGLCPIEIDEFLEAKSKQGAQESIQNSSSSSDDYIAVYISSLAGGHATNLSESLRKMEAETGQRFELVTQESDGEQIDDVDHQQKALVDLWALSMTDVLLTSHMSTFGYTAQGLAGLTPYLIKPWPDNPCWSSLSSDPCFHFAPGKLACKEDNFVVAGGKNNYVRACPDLPDTGLQLVEP